MLQKEIIRIYGKALKTRCAELEEELNGKIQFYYDDGTRLPIIADKLLYFVENNIRE